MLQIEKEIENQFVNYAKTHNVLAVKFIDPGNTGAPDRICFLPGGKILLIEFKKPGGLLSVKQQLYHKRLYELGQFVYTCCSFQQAKEVLDHHVSN